MGVSNETSGKYTAVFVVTKTDSFDGKSGHLQIFFKQKQLFLMKPWDAFLICFRRPKNNTFDGKSGHLQTVFFLITKLCFKQDFRTNSCQFCGDRQLFKKIFLTVSRDVSIWFFKHQIGYFERDLRAISSCLFWREVRTSSAIF